MQRPAPWLKPAVWIVIGGVVSTMIIGFSWTGWVLGAPAERMAVERANSAVIVALPPSCVPNFRQPTPARKLAEFLAEFRKIEFVEEGGWVTPREEKPPHSGVATACADELVEDQNVAGRTHYSQ